MSRHFEGGWGGFPIFLVDLPASFIALLLSNVLGIRTEYVLLVVGTAWWFCIGMLIAKLFTWLSTKTRKVGERPLTSIRR
jgi:hypothetical protein